MLVDHANGGVVGECWSSTVTHPGRRVRAISGGSAPIRCSCSASRKSFTRGRQLKLRSPGRSTYTLSTRSVNL